MKDKNCRICVCSTHSSASPTFTHISHTIHPYFHPYSEKAYRHYMDRYTTISVLRRAFGFEYTIHISIPVDFRCRYMQSSERKSTILTKTIQLLRLRACTAHTQFFFQFYYSMDYWFFLFRPIIFILMNSRSDVSISQYSSQSWFNYKFSE